MAELQADPSMKVIPEPTQKTKVKAGLNKIAHATGLTVAEFDALSATLQASDPDAQKTVWEKAKEGQ